MSFVNKLTWSGFAVLLAAVLAFGLTTSTAYADINAVSTDVAADETISNTETAQVTVDADEGDGNVQVLATDGTLTVVSPVCAGTLGDGTGTVTFIDATCNVDTLILTFTPDASNRNGGNVSIIATQDGDADTTTLRVRGQVTSVTVTTLRAASTSDTACTGTTANVLETAINTNSGLENAVVCVVVKDAAGNSVSGVPVVCTTTEGRLNAATDNTNADGVMDTIVLTADSDAASGDVATITCSAGGVSATRTISFANNNASCTISADPAAPTVGSSSTVTATFLDANGKPVADAQTAVFTAIHSGSGNNAAVGGTSTSTNNGVSRQVILSAIPGPVSVNAAIGSTTCTGTVVFSGTITPVPGTQTGCFATTPAFSSGNPQLAQTVYNGGTLAHLDACLRGVGATGAWAQTSTGQFVLYIVGGPAFANAAFTSAFPNGFSGVVALTLVRN